MGFQENLRYYRERAGYKSAREVAEVLNIPYATYAGYEYKNREAKYPMLIKIAKLLDVSIDDLIRDRRPNDLDIDSKRFIMNRFRKVI